MTTASLQTELWTSWASMLRVYAAAHGLNSTHGAVVEVGAEEIVLRVDTRWVRFTREAMVTGSGESKVFQMFEDGTVAVGEDVDEMDMAAERVARGMFTGCKVGLDCRAEQKQRREADSVRE